MLILFKLLLISLCVFVNFIFIISIFILVHQLN